MFVIETWFIFNACVLFTILKSDQNVCQFLYFDLLSLGLIFKQLVKVENCFKTHFVDMFTFSCFLFFASCAHLLSELESESLWCCTIEFPLL